MALQKLRLTPKVNAGITIENNLNLAGIGEQVVPELEERMAAVYVLCPWHVWTTLPWEDRASALAHFRLHLLIDMHVADASEKAAEMNNSSQQMVPNGFAQR